MYTYMFVKVFTKKNPRKSRNKHSVYKIMGEMLFTNGVRKIR